MRFCTEPKLLRAFDTFWIAWSMDDRLTVPENVNSDESTWYVEPEPNRLMPDTEIVCPSSAPTWNVIVAPPVSRLIPLKEVCAPMSEISAQSCATSELIADLSEADSVPLLYS